MSRTRMPLINSRRKQRGITTLAISIMLLVILSVIVLFATNMAFFDQRTANNENRSRLAEQAAEYAVNLGGEYLKANRSRLISDLPTVGWLDPDIAVGTSRRWARCFSVAGFPAIANFADGTQHPCMSERNVARRGELYFYSVTGVATATAAEAQVPYRDLTPDGIAGPELEATGVGGTAAFPTTTAVQALLCRVDSSCTVATPCTLSNGTQVTAPSCRWQPTAGNRVAVTLIGNSRLTGEGANATVKETWGSVNTTLAMAAVPLVASGLVQSLGNAEIVVAPNAGGYGIPASMWSPNNICMSGGGGCSGIGSVSTCYVGDFLKNTPEAELKTTCATSNNACGCPAATALGSDFLSGHSGSLKREGIDILDIDGCVLDTNTGKCTDGSALPDITFYPGAGLDDVADLADDSLFEWIFGVSYEAESMRSPINGTGNTLQNCAGPANCAVFALTEELGAETKTSCAGMNASTEGLIYVSGACSLSGTIGTPEKPVVIVVNDAVSVGANLVFYGMLFVRSDNNTAQVTGNGNAKIFGSIVVQGDVKLTGGVTLVYDDTAASGCSTPNCLSKSTKFARLPSSWLDSAAGF